MTDYLKKPAIKDRKFLTGQDSGWNYTVYFKGKPVHLFFLRPNAISGKIKVPYKRQSLYLS